MGPSLYQWPSSTSVPPRRVEKNVLELRGGKTERTSNNADCRCNQQRYSRKVPVERRWMKSQRVGCVQHTVAPHVVSCQRAQHIESESLSTDADGAHRTRPGIRAGGYFGLGLHANYPIALQGHWMFRLIHLEATCRDRPFPPQGSRSRVLRHVSRQPFRAQQCWRAVVQGTLAAIDALSDPREIWRVERDGGRTGRQRGLVR